MRIKNVKYISDYKLKILFGNNKTKVVDLSDIVKKSKGIFAPLRELEYFKKVAMDDCQLSICWPNGADICPDVLYEIGKEVRLKKQVKKRSTRRNTKTAIHSK